MRELENNRIAAPDAAPHHKALASGAAARIREMRIERIYGSTLAWWLVWIIWIPVFTPAITGLIEAHPSPPRLILSLAGALLFFTLYLRLTWICAHDLAIKRPIMLLGEAAQHRSDLRWDANSDAGFLLLRIHVTNIASFW